ncbi:RagB/SusD family nutrient uptake outer membrane protein [Chitinophaga sedimenti]|uniref:RagB/SusD family nutrient uptake outer membrane protein n=1 Tax=Chitinophaga sedimenti TaxID=2033606 RepID=UPI00200678F7|nr:RagB/SusD family nutrient uptake outer membrane protein [Chitinophaga sedimenti]MCK7556521.1 RagB/SusD family nutrient uptake outer membrane protein [Chitinophaga sedimenti]
MLTTSVGTSSNPATISPQLDAAFEPNDLRKTSWIGTATIGGVQYRFPYKYKAYNAATAGAKNEYFTFLRISEQYLIRAEAGAQQNMLDDARSDLNVVRERAGLGVTPATTQTAILDAIMKERQVELFCEQGHRWFDLKRTGRIDAVMSVVAPTKGGTWEPYKALMPVPAAERALNNQLDQNDLYN